MVILQAYPWHPWHLASVKVVFYMAYGPKIEKPISTEVAILNERTNGSSGSMRKSLPPPGSERVYEKRECKMIPRHPM